MLHHIPQEALDALHIATALYTVEPVVDALLDRIGWPGIHGDLIDPSAGDGMFLVRALMRLEIVRDDLHSVARVTGWEIHPSAVTSGRERIIDFLTENGWSGGYAQRAARQILRQGDFIVEGPTEPRYRFIAGNPPYMRFSRLPEPFKAIYGPILCDATKGDLLHAFVSRCARVMTDDGVIGLVTSDRWLFNETAANLRFQLGARVGIDYLARLDAATSFYRPKDRRKGSPPRVHPVEVVMRPAALSDIRLDRSPIAPDGQAEIHEGPTLADIATVRLAPWLGPKNIFVVDRKTARDMPADELIPVVDTDDIDPATGKMGKPDRFAIRTCRATEPTGAVRAHLQQEMVRMPKRGCGKTWWMPPEKIIEDLSQPALLIPRIGRTLRVIRLEKNLLPINHNLYVVSTGNDRDLDEIEAILLSSSVQKWVADNAPRLENNFLDIRASLIRRIPVPLGTSN